MVSEELLIAESSTDWRPALFDDAESALRFALRHGDRPLFRDTLGRMQGPGGGRSTLTPDERTAQASLIIRRLESLESLHQALLTLRYAVRQRPCSCGRQCCSGWAVAAGWDNSRAYVVEACIEVFAGSLSHYRLRDGLVRRWAGQKVNVGALADNCGVHRHTVGNHGKALSAWMNKGLRVAVAKADGLLRGAEPLLESAGG